MPFSRNARNNTVWLPAPSPLSCLLITDCAELADITDNSIQLGDSVYCRNPNTGKYEFFTKLDARPDDSTGSVSAPMQTARSIQRLRTQGCPVPLQLRSYACETPGTNINGWDEILHLRNVLFEVQTFSNLTSQLENDDAVPTVQINYEFASLDFITKDIPGYHDDTTTINTVPVSVVYCDSPECGACSGVVSDGCSRMYGLWYDTVALSLLLKTSGDGGVTWTDITPSPAITGVPTDIICSGGRLFLAVGGDIYYNDTPLTVGAWVQSTISGSVTTVQKFAVSPSTVFALYDASGVLASEDFGTNFEVVLLDSDLTAQQQNDIDVDGRVVVTVGENDTIQISQELGEPNSWQLKSSGIPATDDIVAVDVSQWNLAEDRSAVIYIIVDDTDGGNTGRFVYKSEDLGSTWSLKLSLAGEQSATSFAQVTSALESWVVYVNTEGVTRKSVDGGCTWLDISNSSVTPDATYGTDIALCSNEINSVFVIS